MNRKLLFTLFTFITLSAFAQEDSKYWSVGFGVSAIDVYPVGENSPQGDYFDEYFNVNDHWNLGLYVDVSKNLTSKLALGARATYTQLSKWGETNTVDRIPVDNLDYIGLDGSLKYTFLDNTVISPVIGIGGGYTWIEEGPFNTFSNAQGTDNLVGAGTLNGSLGLVFNLSDNISLKAESTYKHAFKDYLTKHFQHTVGFVYHIKEKKIIEKPDSDGDGVTDDMDLCPNVAGLAEYAGCADTDGDGYPDTLDKCPNQKGTDNGCPVPVVVEEEEETVPVVTVAPKEISSAIYFDFDSSELNNNAKEVLDILSQEAKDRSEVNIQVDGYADSIGSNNYNKSLSQKRINSVMDYLVSKGVDKSLFTTNNYGEENPAATNNTKEGRALNRRAKLKVTLK